MLDRLLPPTARLGQLEASNAALAIAATKRVPQASKVTGQDRAVQSNTSSIMARIIEVVASEVGVEKDELTDEALFIDLGIDSLLSISITARLSEVLGNAVPVTLFVDCTSVKQLRAHFARGSDDEPGLSSDSSTCSDAGDILGSPASGSQTRESSIGESSMGQTPAVPGDDLPGLVRNIIASEVGIEVEEIDDLTPLSDLGVDSLLSLSILGAIKDQTGRVLPSTFLIENPTLAAIDSSLGKPPPPKAPQLIRALQKIQSIGAGPNADSVLLQGSSLSQHPSLFLLPDGSGSASSYVGLPTLKLPGAIHGLNSPFPGDPKPFKASLQDVAAVFVREIRRIQPRGPYRLGGWSIGGSYAFEAAHQLIEQHGEAVDHLVLIDAPCPKTLPPLPVGTIDVLERIGAFDGLKERSSWSTTGKVATRAGTRDHFAGSVSALKQYTPAAIPPSVKGPKSVKILWAKNGVWESVADDVRDRYEASAGAGSTARDFMMDPRGSYGTDGWESLVPGADIRLLWCDPREPLQHNETTRHHGAGH